MRVKTTRHNTGSPRHPVDVILDLAVHDFALLCDLTAHRLFVTDAWLVCDGQVAGISLTDHKIIKANVSVQREANHQVRYFDVEDGNNTVRWDQDSGLITAGSNNYWETVITHDLKDPVTIQLDRTAFSLSNKSNDDSGIFLRVMDLLHQSMQQINKKGTL